MYGDRPAGPVTLCDAALPGYLSLSILPVNDLFFFYKNGSIHGDI
jgi:hypothetical protein